MKHFIVALICTLGVIAAAGAATAEAELLAPIHQFIDYFNKGDSAGAEAAHVSNGLMIIDEVPPHLWQGADAFKAWSKDLETHDKNSGITGQKVTLGKVIRTETSADHAYVVIDAAYSFYQKGVAMREPAQTTFVLQKGTGDWKIAGWTWTGRTPQKVK